MIPNRVERSAGGKQTGAGKEPILGRIGAALQGDPETEGTSFGGKGRRFKETGAPKHVHDLLF
jgi:hypothetical protein